MKIAWYSEKLDNNFGHAIYLTPAGEEVVVTTVVDSDQFGDNYPGSSLGDEVRVGEVTHIVKSNYRNFYNDDPRFDQRKRRAQGSERTNNRRPARNQRKTRSR